jgi:hypothetical protein
MRRCTRITRADRMVRQLSPVMRTLISAIVRPIIGSKVGA